MNRDDVIKILSILKIAYPNFYKNISKEDAERTIELYQTMFCDCDTQIVITAIKELINSFKYPPTIADIKNKMYELYNNNNDKSASELWESLIKAISNSGYNSESEFEKLPKEVKDFVRNPRQLKEMAMMDSDIVHSVIKGQFLKQIEVIKERRKSENMMLPETKLLISKIGVNINNLLNE